MLCPLSVTSSRLLNKSSKGDAVAIAEAYRRKKRQEAIGLHKDEVQKAKKFTKIINEHGSNKTSRRRHVLEVSCQSLWFMKQG